MRRPNDQVTSGEDLLVGIDLHKSRWHVTIRTMDWSCLAPVFQGPGKLCSAYWLDMLAGVAADTTSISISLSALFSIFERQEKFLIFNL
jgi:hypothetical protein